MAGFSKNPFGGGSYSSGKLGSSNLFGSSSKDNQNESSGKCQFVVYTMNNEQAGYISIHLL